MQTRTLLLKLDGNEKAAELHTLMETTAKQATERSKFIKKQENDLHEFVNKGKKEFWDGMHDLLREHDIIMDYENANLSYDDKERALYKVDGNNHGVPELLKQLLAEALKS